MDVDRVGLSKLSRCYLTVRQGGVDVEAMLISLAFCMASFCVFSCPKTGQCCSTSRQLVGHVRCIYVCGVKCQIYINLALAIYSGVVPFAEYVFC